VSFRLTSDGLKMLRLRAESQRIPGRRARNSKTPTTHCHWRTADVDDRQRRLSVCNCSPIFIIHCQGQIKTSVPGGWGWRFQVDLSYLHSLLQDIFLANPIIVFFSRTWEFFNFFPFYPWGLLSWWAWGCSPDSPISMVNPPLNIAIDGRSDNSVLVLYICYYTQLCLAA